MISYHIVHVSEINISDSGSRLFQLLRANPSIPFGAKTQKIEGTDYAVICMVNEESGAVASKSFSEWGFTTNDFGFLSDKEAPGVTDPKNLTSDEFDNLKIWKKGAENG